MRYLPLLCLATLTLSCDIGDEDIKRIEVTYSVELIEGSRVDIVFLDEAGVVRQVTSSSGTWTLTLHVYPEAYLFLNAAGWPNPGQASVRVRSSVASDGEVLYSGPEGASSALEGDVQTGFVAVTGASSGGAGGGSTGGPNCTKGKPCGNTCISRDKTCHK